ncbi:MAG: hypothetical protein E6447_19890, partial [Bradyrhizobium sp.]|nr:hypothetical protein [Bradyrhizobium sp.]
GKRRIERKMHIVHDRVPILEISLKFLYRRLRQFLVVFYRSAGDRRPVFALENAVYGCRANRKKLFSET